MGKKVRCLDRKAISIFSFDDDDDGCLRFSLFSDVSTEMVVNSRSYWHILLTDYSKFP